MSLKITPGKWEVSSHQLDEASFVEAAFLPTSPHARAIIVETYRRLDAQANADFIAEAGTVANETGLMPRELLAQRDELLRSLEAALDAVQLYSTGHAREVRIIAGAAIERVRGGK